MKFFALYLIKKNGETAIYNPEEKNFFTGKFLHNTPAQAYIPLEAFDKHFQAANFAVLKEPSLSGSTLHRLPLLQTDRRYPDVLKHWAPKGES